MKTIKTHDRDFFYKYATFNNAKNILSNLQVYCSSPLLFNDPFDTQFDINFGFDLNQLISPLSEEFTEMVFAKEEPQFVKTTPVSVTIKHLRTIRHKLKPDELKKETYQDLEEGIKNYKKKLDEINQAWLEYVRCMRVFCVSEIHDDLLMWAHYAEQHKGVVLKLKCIPGLDTFLCAARPIIYSPTIPILATMKDFIKNLTGQLEIDYNNLYSNLAYTKSDHWDYEKEWRYVVIRPTIKNNLYDMNRLHPEEIDTIYLGCRMSKQNRDEILELLTGKLKHVKVSIASRSKTRFSLDFENITI